MLQPPKAASPDDQNYFIIYDNIWVIKNISRYVTGGTDLERGYGDVQPQRSPFHASSIIHKDPIWATCSSQGSHFKQYSVHKLPPPFSEKKGNFILYNLNFCPNFTSKSSEFGIVSSQDPLSEAMISLQAIHFGNPGCTPLPEKVECPPPHTLLKKISVGWNDMYYY